MPVSLPLPGDVTPVSTVTSPVGLTRTSVPSVPLRSSEPGIEQPSGISSCPMPRPM